MKYILHLATKKNAPFLQVCWWQIYPWSTSFFYSFQMPMSSWNVENHTTCPTYQFLAFKSQTPDGTSITNQILKKKKQEEPANCYIHRKSLHFLKKQSLKVDGETYLHLTVKFFYWIHGFRLQAEDTENETESSWEKKVRWEAAKKCSKKKKKQLKGAVHGSQAATESDSEDTHRSHTKGNGMNRVTEQP